MEFSEDSVQAFVEWMIMTCLVHDGKWLLFLACSVVVDVVLDGI